MNPRKYSKGLNRDTEASLKNQRNERSLSPNISVEITRDKLISSRNKEEKKNIELSEVSAFDQSKIQLTLQNEEEEENTKDRRKQQSNKKTGIVTTNSNSSQGNNLKNRLFKKINTQDSKELKFTKKAGANNNNNNYNNDPSGDNDKKHLLLFFTLHWDKVIIK